MMVNCVFELSMILDSDKFEEVFGDDLDEKQMKETIDGILKDNKELVEKEDWGSLVGILNKSFGSK